MMDVKVEQQVWVYDNEDNLVSGTVLSTYEGVKDRYQPGFYVSFKSETMPEKVRFEESDIGKFVFHDTNEAEQVGPLDFY